MEKDHIKSKVCPCCKTTLPAEKFNKDRTTKDGLNSQCKECRKAASLRDKKKVFARRKKFAARWYKNNREKSLLISKEYARKNAEAIAKRKKEYRANNPEKAADYAKRNRPKLSERWQRRQALKIKATPSWANVKAIVAVYEEAERITRETGIKMEVDHIVPLTSKIVCGLHWEGNLQILTQTENRKKANKMMP